MTDYEKAYDSIIGNVIFRRNMVAHHHHRGDVAIPLVGMTITATAETLKASGTVTFKVSGTLTAKVSARVIAKPPGYLMSRIARGVFFFSPKTVERVFEEVIDDYWQEMVKAEANGEPTQRIRMLRAQHWGGFIGALVQEIVRAIGAIVKTLKGG
jgi:hypothetical protein